jgi:hypothetical protein
VTGGEIFQGLKNIADFHPAFDPPPDGFPERFLEIPPDHEHDLLETRPDRVVYGVIDDELTVGSHGLHLLQTAVAAAHSSRHHHQYRPCVILFPPAGHSPILHLWHEKG